MKSVTLICVAAFCASVCAVHAQSQRWPNKPIRVIVPFAPGGAGDVIARMITPKLAEDLAQTFIVDNRAGAGGSLGGELMVRSNPDGYTIMVGASSYSANAAYYTLSWEPINGVSPVSQLTRGPFVLAVFPGVQANNLKDFLELLRAKPGTMTFGSSGTGGVPHLAGELFLQMSKTRMVHAPYKGDGPAIVDMLGGHIQAYWGGPIVLSQHINAGKLRGLAVSGDQRLKIFPDLPAVGEHVPGYAALTWHGVWAPKGTHADIVLRLNQAIGRMLKQPDIQTRLAASGLDAMHNTPSEFSRFIADEIVKYRKVVKDGNIKTE